MFDYLQSMQGERWKPVSRPSLIAWLAFYVAFLAYAFSAHGGFLFIDTANLIVHEGGHNLFGWFGPTLGLWGGTLLQWLVPFLLAAYFFTERQVTAFVFCGFFFFENWLYTATYMADARAQILPLVTTGDPDFVEHDFHAIFSHLGLLNYDITIAARGAWLGLVRNAGNRCLVRLRGFEEEGRRRTRAGFFSADSARNPQQSPGANAPVRRFCETGA